MLKPQPKVNANTSDADRERLDAFKKDIASDADAMDDQRECANDDMRFVNVDGGMWDGFFEDKFNKGNRVKLEMDVTSNPLNRFIGEWNQNRVGVNFKPDDSGTTKDDSDLLNGIYRSDYRKYSGKMATDNAVMETATVGFGAFKLANDFDDDGDPENENQHIEWRPIHNAYNTVIWDQSALRIDKRDAGHCTVLKQYTRGSWEKEYPGKDVASAFTPDDDRPDPGASVEIFYTATRYEIVKKKIRFFIYNNLNTEKIEAYSKDDHEAIKSELAEDETRVFVRERDIVRQICEKTVFSGTEILEPTRKIAGRYIPVIPVYGYRAFVDGTERYRGIVRKMKDANRLFNMQVSQVAEDSASGGQEIPIFLRDQVSSPDIEAQWADKNNKPYLAVDAALDDDGNMIATGPIGYNRAASLNSSTAALLEVAPNYIRESTGFVAGDAIDKEASGKALKAIMKRENMNTQVIDDNIETAIEWSGEVYQAMAQEIYTTARMVGTLDKDGTNSTVNLLEPVMDQETGVMIESNDLRTKKFKSYSDAGPQYETQREETVEDMKGIIEALKDTPGGDLYIPIALNVLFDNMTGTNIEPLVKFNRERMLLNGTIQPVTDEDIAFVEQQAQNQGPDPQEALMAAATAQQEAEARNLDAASAEKVAAKGLKEAQTAKVISDIQVDQEKVAQSGQSLLLEARKQAREQLARLPIDRARPQ